MSWLYTLPFHNSPYSHPLPSMLWMWLIDSKRKEKETNCYAGLHKVDRPYWYLRHQLISYLGSRWSKSLRHRSLESCDRYMVSTSCKNDTDKQKTHNLSWKLIRRFEMQRCFSTRESFFTFWIMLFCVIIFSLIMLSSPLNNLQEHDFIIEGQKKQPL